MAWIRSFAKIPVLLKGILAPDDAGSGRRSRTDVVKALALGAQAVLIGRPYLWGLAVDGAAGVQRVIEILQAELETAMALCGTPSLGRISRQLVWPSP